MLEDERRYDEPFLDEASRSPEVSVRSAAAHAAGSIGDPRGAGLLARAAVDAAAPVRAAAALGLEILGVSEKSSVLLPLLSDPDRAVDCAAARSLAHLHEASGETALVAALSGAAAETRPCLLEALARYGTESAAAVARGYLSSSSPAIRASAIYAASRNPVASSIPALVSALKDASGDSAAFAARGLGIVGRAEELLPLLDALDRPEFGVLASAVNAIDQIEKREASPLPAGRLGRIVALSSDANPNIALPALNALRHFTADRRAFSVLNAAAASGSGRRREIALQSLVIALKERAASRLEDAVSSREAGLRRTAAECLSGLPETAASAFRDRLLRDSETSVRAAALASFPAEPGLAETARRFLSDPDFLVRTTAIDRLSESNDPAMVADLRAALATSMGDSSPDVALAIVAAAASRKSPEAKSLVTEIFGQHPRALVRRLARRSLIDDFGVPAAEIADVAYSTGRTVADYERILRQWEKPRVAAVETTHGTIRLRLDGIEAPLTAENFVSLARRGFFNGVTFHRVVANFVAQAGDPTGTGSGGPGYEIRDEISAGGFARGAVGMALSGPDTGGSQFFITISPQPHLDGAYPIFGRLLSGQEVVERIEQGDRILKITVEGEP
jgi:cyclophilin family peptidyl-prolyl cis-trans isomerase/HEAT repeat protein